MISLELSMVQHNRAESARLADATEAFMRGGGHVTELESGIARPDTIAMKYNTPRGEAAGKTESMQRLRIIPDIEEAKAKAPDKRSALRIDKEQELKLVERIKALRDIGLTRRQATRQLEIGNTLFFRLLTDYSIDYPKAVNRFG